MDLVTREYIKKLPKAELHLHLEGAVTPEMLLELSAKYGTELQGSHIDQVKSTYFDFVDFSAFLETFKLICQHLKSVDDYVGVFQHLETYFEEQNILYAEVIYTPSIPWRFGRDGEQILDALLKQSALLQERKGARVQWILDNVRQFGPEDAQRTAELAYQYRDRGVVAIGLGGDEKSIPLEEYGEVFSWAKAHQLFTHVHAGEVGPPEEISRALKVLGANRIGHGIQAARDPKLMGYLREHAIGLDICLTSNVKTRAWAPLSEHPFALLWKRGVPLTLSTDDPGVFLTTLNEEYAKAVKTFDLSIEDLQRLVLQGVRSSFLPHQEKMELMETFHRRIQKIL